MINIISIHQRSRIRNKICRMFEDLKGDSQETPRGPPGGLLGPPEDPPRRPIRGSKCVFLNLGPLRRPHFSALGQFGPSKMVLPSRRRAVFQKHKQKHTQNKNIRNAEFSVKRMVFCTSRPSQTSPSRPKWCSCRGAMRFFEKLQKTTQKHQDKPKHRKYKTTCF